MHRVAALLVASVFLIGSWTEPAHAQDGALQLGNAGYIDLGDPDGDAFDIVAGEGRTYALWTRHDETMYHAKLLDKRRKGPPVPGVEKPGFTMFIHQFTGTPAIFLDPSSIPDGLGVASGTSALSTVVDDTWHHVAYVWAGNDLMIYVDGRLDTRYTYRGDTATLSNPFPLWVGWNGDDRIHYMGAVDELSIWHRALTEREIRSLMYSTPRPDAEDLAAYYPMDAVAASGQVLDHGPNGYHGTAYDVTRIDATRPLSPPLTEQWWFYVLVGLSGLGLVYGLMRGYAWRIERQRRQLETVVGERTTELSEALEVVAAQAEELKTLDEAKSRFFANISHEFRTPLTLTLGPLEDMLRGRYGTPDDTLKQPIKQVMLNNQRLLRLVNQLLDVAKLEAHQLEMETRHVELGPYLHSIGQAFVPLAERKEIRFTRTLPKVPLASPIDPEHFEKVVINLLSNAFKFTPNGRDVALTLAADGEQAVIRVRDTGPGISEDEQEHIFNRFYQTRTGRASGTGIGLALAKEIVELHDGTISVESEVGFGACFTVTLPSVRVEVATVLAPSVAPQAADVVDQPTSPETTTVDTEAESPGDAVADQPTVLVVDDNDEIRSYVRSHLDAYYRVLEAEDGEAGLQMARAHMPDLVLSDVMMPKLDGYGLCRAIKADAELAFIPVVLLTAKASSESKLAGLGVGADDYLTKPFSSDELLARIHNLIAQRKRLQALFLASPPAPTAALANEAEVPSADAAWTEQLRNVATARMADEHFNVEALAEAMGMDRTNLYRRMQTVLDRSPSAFLHEVRLARGAQLLLARTGTVSEVAYGVGYKSVQHFARRFRRQFGCSPTEYAQAEAAPAAQPA
ncbi:MAG: ATP-binding protein, partial [Bacteroidota bacterium]